MEADRLEKVIAAVQREALKHDHGLSGDELTTFVGAYQRAVRTLRRGADELWP
jgi:hypothetical protein